MVKAKPDINEEPVFVGPDQFSPEHAFFGNFRWKLRDFEVTETWKAGVCNRKRGPHAQTTSSRF